MNLTTAELSAAYIECALWSSTDDNDTPLDRNYTSADIAEESLAQMHETCETFLAEQGDEIAAWPGPHYAAIIQAGHDLWLTQNRHGAGFWDGDWPEPAASRLTEAAHKLGGCSLYVGDDGLLYLYDD